MILERSLLYDKEQTAKKMKFVIGRFFNDLQKIKIRKDKKIVPLPSLTVVEFFYIVRSIPYRKDNSPIEIIARPKHILRHKSLGMDCKKKSILMSSFLKLKNIPYRLMGVSRKRDKKIHHVYTQGLINGNWRNLDATYGYCKPFQKKLITNCEVL